MPGKDPTVAVRQEGYTSHLVWTRWQQTPCRYRESKPGHKSHFKSHCRLSHLDSHIHAAPVQLNPRTNRGHWEAKTRVKQLAVWWRGSLSPRIQNARGLYVTPNTGHTYSLNPRDRRCFSGHSPSQLNVQKNLINFYVSFRDNTFQPHRLHTSPMLGNNISYTSLALPFADAR
jgi:hypothetical protein